MGTARVTDGCGQVGSVYTNEIIAVPDGDLMTLSLDVPIGSHFVQADREQLFSTISSYTKPLKVADLACPTWGIAGTSGLWIYGHKGKEDTTVFVTTIGSPFHPIIIPPSNLLSFDTAWGKCSSFPDAVQLGKADGTGGNLRFEIFDPPRVLTPVAALVPTTTSASLKSALDRDLTSSISAAPADSGSPSLPVNTNGPHVKMSKPGPAASSRQASFTSGHDSAIEHIEPSPVHSEHRPSRKPSTNLGLSSQPSLTEPGHEPSNFPPANRGQDPPKESGEQPAQAPPADSNDERVQVSSESQEHQQQTNRRKLEHQGSSLSNSGKASHIVLSINHVVPHSPETGLSFDMNSAPTSKDGDDSSTRSGLAAIIYDAFGRSDFHAPSKIFHDTQDTATKTSSFIYLPTLASAVTSVADQLPSIIDSLNLGQSKLSTSGDFVMELSESVLSLSTSSDDPIIETRIPVTRAIALLPGSTSTRAADQLVAGITFSVGKSPVTISGTVFSSLASKALVIANASIRPSKSIFPQHSPFFAAGGIKTTAASGSAPIFFFNSTLNSARKAETTSVSGTPGSLGFVGVMHTSTGGNVDLPTANTSTSTSGSNAMTALRGSQSKTNVPRKLMSFGGCIIFGLAKISF